MTEPRFRTVDESREVWMGTPRRSPYYERIREILARNGYIGMLPEHIEAWMRLECNTLDGLSPQRFEHEVLMGVACVQQGGAGPSSELARSYGLL